MVTFLYHKHFSYNNSTRNIIWWDALFSGVFFFFLNILDKVFEPLISVSLAGFSPLFIFILSVTLLSTTWFHVVSWSWTNFLDSTNLANIFNTWCHRLFFYHFVHTSFPTFYFVPLFTHLICLFAQSIDLILCKYKSHMIIY